MFRPSTVRRFSALSLSPARTFSASARSNVARMSIIGRLAAEPERVNTSTGRELVKYVIGSNYGTRENQKTSWFRVTSFDDAEERVNYLTSLPRGTLLFVEGEPQLQTYTVENEKGPDGQPLRRTSFQVIQRGFQVLQRSDRAGQDHASPAHESTDPGA